MELMVPIENKDSIPLYEQIYRYIKTEIRAGRLRAGSRLPSTRTLADNLHVSRSTTQLAYEQLLSEGYIEALPCRGIFCLSDRRTGRSKISRSAGRKRGKAGRK